MNYLALPFDSESPERAEIVSTIFRSLFEQETIWTDFQDPCEEKCGECSRCGKRATAIVKALSDPDSEAWEVWTDGVDEEVRLVGVIYATNIVEGCEATAHYCFFDGKLRDKEPLLEQMLERMFDRGFHRISVEVPAYAHALAKHAKRLGFEEEGRKREARKWNGKWWDVIIMGRVAPEES